jgi:hypothetical protein
MLKDKIEKKIQLGKGKKKNSSQSSYLVKLAAQIMRL